MSYYEETDLALAVEEGTIKDNQARGLVYYVYSQSGCLMAAVRFHVDAIAVINRLRRGAKMYYQQAHVYTKYSEGDPTLCIVSKIAHLARQPQYTEFDHSGMA